MSADTPQQNPDPNKVWISREEYERLRAMDVSQSTNRTFVAPDKPYVSTAPDHTVSDGMFRTQKIVGFILAIALLIALSVSAGSWIVLAIVFVFLLFAIFSTADYAKQRKRESSLLPDDLPGGKSSTVIKHALLAIAIVIAIPVLANVAMIVLFMMLIAASGGQAGS